MKARKRKREVLMDGWIITRRATGKAAETHSTRHKDNKHGAAGRRDMIQRCIKVVLRRISVRIILAIKMMTSKKRTEGEIQSKPVRKNNDERQDTTNQQLSCVADHHNGRKPRNRQRRTHLLTHLFLQDFNSTFLRIENVAKAGAVTPALDLLHELPSVYGCQQVGVGW